MNKVRRKEGGFTFLELLMVLAVIVIMTAIILPFSDKWIRTTSEKDAIQALIASIQNLQAYSMANHVVTKLEFQHSGSEYFTSVIGKPEFSRTRFPDGMRLASSSRLKSVEFHANGDIIHSGTLTLLTSTGQTEIRLQFQRGRMIIYE
nr:prepilin-type N-terminal cleavage/methylation domain-containing protein [Sporosarcina sp. ACRSM]